MREKRLDVIYLQQLFHGITIKNFCHVKLIKVNISYILLSRSHFSLKFLFRILEWHVMRVRGWKIGSSMERILDLKKVEDVYPT